jgi:hypothetical protein
MNALRCTIVRWVSGEPQPGWVAAEVVDARGRVWTFFDKPPMFTDANVRSTTPLPMGGFIRCEIRGRRTLSDGRSVVRVFTIDCEAENGERDFDVEEPQLEPTAAD